MWHLGRTSAMNATFRPAMLVLTLSSAAESFDSSTLKGAPRTRAANRDQHFVDRARRAAPRRSASTKATVSSAVSRSDHLRLPAKPGCCLIFVAQSNTIFMDRGPARAQRREQRDQLVRTARLPEQVIIDAHSPWTEACRPSLVFPADTDHRRRLPSGLRFRNGAGHFQPLKSTIDNVEHHYHPDRSHAPRPAPAVPCRRRAIECPSSRKSHHQREHGISTHPRQ